MAARQADGSYVDDLLGWPTPPSNGTEIQAQQGWSLGGAADQVGEFFGDLWDRGLGVLDKLADFELSKWEYELYSDYQQNAAAAQAALAPQPQPVALGFSGVQLAGLALAGVALVYLLARR